MNTNLFTRKSVRYGIKDFHTLTICDQSIPLSKFPNKMGDRNSRSQKTDEIRGSRIFNRLFLVGTGFIAKII